jgi:hypothetical protein
MKYFIFQTRLLNESKFLGRVALKGTYNQEALVERMLEMGSSLTKPDITAVLQLLAQAIERVCSEGYKINLDGVLQVTPAIGGSFDGKNDTFSAPRNTLYLTAQVARAMNERIAKNASIEKLIVDENRPILLEVNDSEAAPEADKLVFGHIISVSGKRLKFDQTQAGEYLRLVNAADSADYVPVTSFHKLGDQELVFRLPQTTFTEGYFEVASSLGTASVRIGRSLPFAMGAA